MIYPNYVFQIAVRILPLIILLVHIQNKYFEIWFIEYALMK